MNYDFNEELYRDISNRLEAVKESIAECAAEAGRDKNDITLVGVSKVFPVEYAEAAHVAGLKDLGENRVQELVPKIERFGELDLNANWHLIGTLQKNKVKYIVGKTHLIHSVNTIELAQEIGKRSVCNNVISDILLQVNVSREESQHGFDPDQMKEIIEQINSTVGIRTRGIMTMAPIQEYDGQARSVFEKTKKLFDSFKGDVNAPECWDVLSMGMSGDYRYAILEGATHIRIGTSIFGNRMEYTESQNH